MINILTLYRKNLKTFSDTGTFTFSSTSGDIVMTSTDPNAAKAYDKALLKTYTDINATTLISGQMPITLIVLCKALTTQIPVGIGTQINPLAGLIIMLAVKAELIKAFITTKPSLLLQLADVAKPSGINKLLTDLQTALTIELSPWAINWIAGKASTISQVAASSGSLVVPSMMYDQLPPIGTGNKLPDGSLFRAHFAATGKMDSDYGGNSLLLLIDAIAIYMKNIFPLFKNTTPIPFLPSAF